MLNDVLACTKKLIEFQSITPHDKGCQGYIKQLLEQMGFSVTPVSQSPVDNLWAEIGNKSGPSFAFAGHTDVVNPGLLDDWKSPPFEPSIRENVLYGRGAADMKSSLAAMLTACYRFLSANKTFNGRIGFIITSGEEGEHFDLGTPHVMQHLAQQGKIPDLCLVGEPSSTKTVGDTIKVGRRGSLSARVTVKGVQGHVAYPHLAQNPIHLISPALDELCHTSWDEGCENFPPTSFQISNIKSGTGAGNVIPGELFFQFNFRYNPQSSDTQLKNKVEAILDAHRLNYEIKWRLNGKPFLTHPGTLIDACEKAISTVTGQATLLSTSGGTSDGRFIAPYGCEVIELGPVNKTIHQVNECIAIDELVKLEAIYLALLNQLFK